MRASLFTVAFAVALSSASTAAGQTPKKCPIESVKVGGVCVDKYEASVWQVPADAGSLMKKIKQGKATLADLTAAGATQLGCTDPPYGHADFPPEFPQSGNWTPLPGTNPPTPGVYALSIPGVLPTACISQLRAAQACALSEKHLIRNDEWQRAAASTPDNTLDDGVTTCVTGGSAAIPTGTRAACVSAWGVYDMIGNVNEWVADWVDSQSTPGNCALFDNLLFSTGDGVCFGGDGTYPFPGVPYRGGQAGWGDYAGIFAITSDPGPIAQSSLIGFRCAR